MLEFTCRLDGFEDWVEGSVATLSGRFNELVRELEQKDDCFQIEFLSFDVQPYAVEIHAGDIDIRKRLLDISKRNHLNNVAPKRSPAVKGCLDTVLDLELQIEKRLLFLLKDAKFSVPLKSLWEDPEFRHLVKMREHKDYPELLWENFHKQRANLYSVTHTRGVGSLLTLICRSATTPTNSKSPPSNLNLIRSSTPNPLVPVLETTTSRTARPPTAMPVCTPWSSGRRLSGRRRNFSSSAPHKLKPC
jgi:hypothetical protein